MKQVAKFLEDIKLSTILALSAKAQALKAQGLNIINLTVGELDYDTPNNIKSAAIKAIESGKTKYTPVEGILELRKAIQEKYAQRITGVEIDNIIVSSGAKQSLYNCFMATINPGEEVIIPAPYWVSYPDIVMLAKGRPVIIETSEEESFKIMPAKLVEKITAKTKWIILNSPSNPTGMKYSKEELEGIAKVLENYPHIGIVSDDIYEDVNFTGEALSLIDIAPGLLDRILVVNGLSKSYAMTGWRIGYSLGNKEIINAMKIIQSQSTSNPCSISQYAALEALTGDQIFPKSLGNIFKERCNVALKELRDIDGVSCLSPEGAFYLFPSCKKFLNKRTQEGTIIKNDYDFCEYLLADAKVAVVPGSSFGLSGYFRISYAVSKETIVEGIQKIKESCNKLI